MLLAAALALPTLAVGASPFDPGPHAVATFELGTRRDPLAHLAPWHVAVTTPTQANATTNATDGAADRAAPSASAVPPLPVYVFVTGFAGEEPSVR